MSSCQVLPLKDPQLLESISESPPLLTIPEIPSVLKTSSVQSYIPPYQAFYLSRSLPLRGLPCPEDPNFKLEVPNNRSSMIFVDTYATPSSVTFITCNTPISGGSYGQ